MSASPHSDHHISARMTFFLALCCGLIVANLYYSQPLAGPISQALNMSPESAGLIVTLTQIGYVIGLLLVVPLADLVENRKLILAMLGLSIVAVLGAALADNAVLFLTASLLIGVGAVAVQVIVPLAAHLASEERRGQVVGNVMSGLMFGIMLARPVSSFITDLYNWHAVFVFSAVVMLLLGVAIRVLLPPRVPRATLSYGSLLASMGGLALHTPILQRRAFYQAMMFGAFSLFWTTTPLLLAGPAFNMSQSGIALFALAGVAGAVSAPLAGRVADAGWTRSATLCAMLLAIGSFAITLLLPLGSTTSLMLLVLAAVLLDFGVSANVVLGQRAIYGLSADLRSRLNGLYMATFFVGGAIGSAVGVWGYAHGGWLTAALLGGSMPALALFVLWLVEPKTEATATLSTSVD
ncbi:MAG: MFS transporter [Halopseudomonas sabulinigri]|tara:strand:- start:732 stop:1958 length:1227 start_codon:yes stop_codon:yes gene_type:complete